MKTTDILWVEKSFNFGLQPGQFPLLLESLRSTPQKIERLVEGLTVPALVARPENKWSIQENIGHLADIEELHMGRLQDYDNNLTALRPADMSNTRTNEARHNEKLLKTVLDNFGKVRKSLIDRAENMTEEYLLRSAYHPRLKRQMRVIDMFSFIAEHDGHHMARISRIRSMLNRN
jgi:uncharacterized damage-inducible protein DinB